MDAPAFPARWQVSEPELIAETFSSRIWKVRREDGSPAIVKALKPFDDVADELRGEHFLAWRRGEGRREDDAVQRILDVIGRAQRPTAISLGKG